MKKTLLLLSVLFTGLYLHALQPKRTQDPQEITISGVVKDVSSGETLPFANVLVIGTDNGTTTNVDGYFTLFHVPVEDTGLQITYIGYRTKTIKVKPSMEGEHIEILLDPTTEELDEIVLSAQAEQEVVRFNKKVSQVSLSPKELASIPNLGEKDIFRA